MKPLRGLFGFACVVCLLARMFVLNVRCMVLEWRIDLNQRRATRLAIRCNRLEDRAWRLDERLGRYGW